MRPMTSGIRRAIACRDARHAIGLRSQVVGAFGLCANVDASRHRDRGYQAVQSTLRSFDLAHLAHVELFTPKPDESLRFFVDVMGMTESGRSGQSVYLRGWDDYEHHTLKLTE